MRVKNHKLNGRPIVSKMAIWGPCEDDTALKEELADVMNYCIQLAQKQGYDICKILNEKNRQKREEVSGGKKQGREHKIRSIIDH